MTGELVPANPGEFLFYQSDDGRTRVEVRFQGDTVWLSQKAMAELFQKDVRTISEHIRNIFDEGELQEGATIRKFRIVQSEGTRQVEREVDHYNLDVIISVGYRVKSLRGTQFRIWATQRLKHPTDQPTVGLILCETHNRLLAEYSFACFDQPIGISTYELTRSLPPNLRSALPTVEEIEAEFGGGKRIQRSEPTKRKKFGRKKKGGGG